MKITPAALKAAADGDISNFIAAASPGGIERQEAAGQAAMVSNFKTLPKEMSGEKYNDFAAGRAVAEAFGFEYGPDVDELFVSVTAPAGWSLSATGHSMHSDILDEHGHVRGSIFYKAAFYDRRAHGRWATRYHFDRRYDEAPGSRSYTLRVIDSRNTAEPIWSERFEYAEGEDYSAYSKREEAISDRGTAFLNERFPEWRNPTSYWSDGIQKAAANGDTNGR